MLLEPRSSQFQVVSEEHWEETSRAVPLSVQVRSCWTDIAEAIEAAEELVYITGWSMHPGTRLIRNGGHDGIAIGTLLKQKAASKVNVCLLVCHSTFGLSFMLSRTAWSVI
jgi:hypothetical protein